MLVQDVGLWSGNRRKMEIAECRTYPENSSQGALYLPLTNNVLDLSIPIAVCLKLAVFFSTFFFFLLTIGIDDAVSRQVPAIVVSKHHD
jgi:hypothetical protein